MASRASIRVRTRSACMQEKENHFTAAPRAGGGGGGGLLSIPAGTQL
jgi:hypothetical protein